jgi:hypothetical protein
VLSRKAKIDPMTLVEGDLHGIDHFLDPGAGLEIALILRASGKNLRREVGGHDENAPCVS